MRVIVAYKKIGMIRHIGHLDMQRTMQRVLRRSGLPVRYSQGFNPHTLLSFAAPLSVGMEGDEELMDVALESPVSESEFSSRMTSALPESIPLVAVRTIPDEHPKLMAMLNSTAYEATCPLSYEAAAMLESVPSILQIHELMAMRKTKSGEHLQNIRPMLFSLSANRDSHDVVFSMHVQTNEQGTLKPSLLMETLSKLAGIQDIPEFRYRRSRLFGISHGFSVPLIDMQND